MIIKFLFDLVKEVAIGFIVVLVPMNIYGIVHPNDGINGLLFMNFYLFMYLFTSLLSFHVGYFILFISLRSLLISRCKFNIFIYIVLLVFPYIFMNLFFLEMVNNVYLLRMIGFVFLIVGLYLYLKVELAKEKNTFKNN